MSSIKIHWTPFALKCLDDIFEFISHESKSNISAKKLVFKVIESTEQLERFPQSGTIEPLLEETGQGSRYLVADKNYKLIYQIVDKTIIITDVFHVKQNPAKIQKRNN